MILYLKDPKNSTQKLLDTMNIFSSVTGYKNEQTEKEYRKTIPFTIASKEIPRSKLNEGGK
jgi:hypothetical protein